ncbi:SHOCT domain-containing protein [Oceanobacillus luteolus]|uniref:SHOCT domain-containing protein n=1 Tax=Oceanobacillus luteolus TaxID=1274358 RepID=A0ABW4HMP1_9BACI|nr:SHOCT domain-containing protein [Oceanobacillus luteolus]MCM3740523.1 SHOCT domain-containing protein [Oceanobacillus luteolus]
MPTEMIIRLILAAILFVVIVIILVRFRRGKSNTDARDSLEIMKERYEKGEITKEDYEEQKRRRGKA